jgi:hypothetical protein
MASLAVRERSLIGGASNRWPIDQIGGGRVVRQFRLGDSIIKVGSELSAEFIRQLPAANRQVLIGQFIAVWPKASEVAGLASTAADANAERPQRHVVALGFGRYKVIEGVELTPEAVTRSEAYAIAGKPEPKKPDPK